MQAHSMKCPNCGTDMKKVKEPDISTDVCPSCGGVYLEKGEINVLASGMAGDIEGCSMEGEVHDDRFPTRKCPKCQGQDMTKINLLRYSDIIFDFCPVCEGFFLDKGEVTEMNVYLAELTEQGKPEEYRGYINNHLVISKIVGDVNAVTQYAGLVQSAVGVSYLRISVYYTKSLDMGLRIYSQKWTHRFLKTVGLFKKQDIPTGYTELDNAFIIQGDKVEEIKSLLSSSEIQKELMDFANQSLRVFLNPGSLELLDDRIVYVEGPYSGSMQYDVEEDSSGIVNRMVRLATLLSSK